MDERNRIVKERTQWFADCGWGIMCHWVPGGFPRYAENKEAPFAFSPEEWNRQVDAFDIEAFAGQLADIGVPYIFFTVGHGTGYYCAPNEAYDRFMQRQPSRCSRRDLIADLGQALNKKGVNLLLYLSSTPGRKHWDPEAWEKLGYSGYTWEHGRAHSDRMADYQRKREAIIREWSERWGDLVRGWWIDGCYAPQNMFDFAEDPNWHSLAAALRAGNPDAILAFAPGAARGVRWAMTSEADYLAGENHQFLIVPNVEEGAWVTAKDGSRARFHALTYLGTAWGYGEPRFADDLPTAYARHIVGHGGVCTFDVPISKGGLLPEAFARQLGEVSRACSRKNSA